MFPGCDVDCHDIMSTVINLVDCITRTMYLCRMLCYFISRIKPTSSDRSGESSDDVLSIDFLLEFLLMRLQFYAV